MYLKRLEIQGFKSFANKTHLEFSPGVTCVIGPNGTGKTNVADSLRWVLGEHASRTLRARKTEDVIFAGSDKRAAMGLAEVSISLDNSGHWLPIDYGEVVVTRRAYRSGENEYLINNAKVRLRDVVELFQRAQVGQNSYAFMGQGMVEQVLSLRPEDRRALIEEAADVRLYRTKLEDAQNKLKATHENLDRVRMLIREIEPRINQLERQAGRAVKYHELTQELNVTLHAWYSHQWQDVNAHVLAAITTQDQRAEEFEQARQGVRSCEDGLAQLRSAIDERRAEINARETRLRNLQDYARDLERRAALDAERSRMLTERIDELATEIQALEADLSAQAQTASPETDTSDLESRLATARQQLAEQRTRLATVEQELLTLQRSALSNEQSAARARALADDLARRASEAADAIARLRREQDAADDERKRTIADLAAWSQSYARLRSEIAALAPQLETAIGQRARSIDEAARALSTAEVLDEELRELRGRMEAAQIRLEVLETVDVQPQAPDAGIRMILEAGGVMRRESVPEGIELEGILGVVRGLIRVPGGYERAIAAALAENAIAIVVARQSDIRPALELLIEGDAGMATFYALDAFREQRPINLIKERGVLGVASSFVRCEGRYRRLIDTLLGRTVICQDVPTAQRFIRRGLASAVATIDGVLLRAIGSVSVGQPASVTAEMTLNRQASDLPDEIERLRPEIDAKQANVDQYRQRAAEAQQRVTDLDAAIETQRAARARHETALAESRARLGSFQAMLTTHTQTADRRAAEVARLSEIQLRATAEHEQRMREALAAEEKEQADRRAIAELETARKQLLEAAGETAATVAQLDGELRAERGPMAGDRQSRDRISRQLSAKTEQRTRAEQEAHEIVQRLEAERRELNEKNGEIDGLDGELEPARQELQQLESRERSMSAELVEANARVRETERATVDAEHNVRARNEELHQLRETLEADGFITTDAGEVERAPTPEPVAEPEFEPADDYEQHGDNPPRWLRDGDADLPPIRGGSTLNPTEIRDRIIDLRAQIRNLGPVNEQAASDYADSRERYDFLTGQLTDLQQAEEQLHVAIAELETVIRDKFRTTFKVVNREFERYFSAFFRGGTARLELGETDDEGLPGVEIFAQPPGKKLGSLALLSGGERSLTAVALLFALLQANPSPICVLDEVDAALDEANVGRFVEELRALAQKTQFIIITHNRRTIENADSIYGVSMGADNVSRVLSLKLADVPPGD
jgi:chromosome segregation protein